MTGGVFESCEDLQSQMSELFNGKPPFVNLEFNGRKKRVRYSKVFSDIPFTFKDRDFLIQWTPTKLNPSAFDDDVKDLISGIEWDRNEFHDQTARIESDLLLRVVDIIENVYAKGKRLSGEWWANLTKGFQLVAALRDYHDYRMGLTKNIYKKYSKIFVSGGYSPNSLRDYKHFFRIWNCVIFPCELRIMLEGPGGVDQTGERFIPRSVVQLLLEGKNMPYFTREKLEGILCVVDADREKGRGGVRVRSGFVKISRNDGDYLEHPVSCL